ncbi:hypothetical protein I4U23_008665 [Adineta vaga]|nr:hypothetical protein I4U23_008665 [Adineta vaga]
MTTDNISFQNIENSSNIIVTATTAIINSHWTTTSNSFTNDKDDMKHTLTYAIPLSCFAIVIVLIIALGIHRRHRALEKWSSLTRMRNTNPRYIERGGLRRDSEYESHNDGFIHVTIINEDGQFQKEPEFRLASIT